MRPEVKRYSDTLDESMTRFRERATGLLGPWSGEGLLVDLEEATFLSLSAAIAIVERGGPAALVALEDAYHEELVDGIIELRAYLAEHDQVLEEHDPGASALYQ